MQTTSMTKTTIGTTMVGTVLDVLFSFPRAFEGGCGGVTVGDSVGVGGTADSRPAAGS